MHNHTINLGKFKRDLTITSILQKTKFSEVYNCRFYNIDAVLKFKKHNLFENNIDLEQTIHLKLAPYNLAPRFLDHDKEANLVIYEKIVGTSMAPHPNKKNLYEIALKLRDLHSIKIDNYEYELFEEKIEKYFLTIGEQAQDSVSKNAKSFIKKVTADKSKLVFCHNDLNLSNIIYAEKIYFIDWDYAGLNHPYFDIATLLNALDLSQDEVKYFLNSYTGTHNTIDLDALDSFKKLALYVEYLWIVATASNEDEKYRDRYLELKKRLQ